MKPRPVTSAIRGLNISRNPGYPQGPMRIATWNVNSLRARLDKVVWWLERAKPDVLLMQETKLTDADAPVATFREHGYELAHHGEGRWNGVAIASRSAIEHVVTNFGEPLRPAKTPDVGDDEPMAEGMAPGPSGRRSRSGAGGASWTRTGCMTRSRAATRGGTIVPAISARTSACASTTCSSRPRSPSAPCGPRSIARHGRASRCP